MSDHLMELTGKVASVTAEIHAHKDECSRRYEEGNQRLEKIFTYIKEAHADTNRKIEQTTNDTNRRIESVAIKVGKMQTGIDEDRGAGKVGKIIAHSISVLIGGGVIGTLVNFFHK